MDLEKIESLSNNLKSYFCNHLFEENYPEALREAGLINDDYNINEKEIENFNFGNFGDFAKINDETDESLNFEYLKKTENNKEIQLKLMDPLNIHENTNKITKQISIKNNTNIDKSIIINDKSEKEKESILIGKKRRLFNITYPKAFIIFNKGGNDNYIRQLIKESLQNNKEYFFSKRAKKRKEKKERKDGKDNIRKKIKARFLKALKNRVNELLSLAGSKRIFNYLQQEFIININKEINIGVLDLTFKELYSKDFCKDKINNNSSLQKYNDNQSVLKYLEEEKEISEKSKYDIFKSMKYYQIFDEYLRSKEFESDIYKLKKTNNYKYIKNYIKLAFDLNDFFSY
jgi:hypothetical protein